MTDDTLPDFAEREISGGPGNVYGRLWIRCVDGAPQWSIENWNGNNWLPCPPQVFLALRTLCLRAQERDDARHHAFKTEAEIARLTAERDDLRQHVEDLQAKIDIDRSCACSYDAAGDVCAAHSPALAKAEVEIVLLRKYWGEVSALNSQQRELLDLYRAAVVISPTRDGPLYAGCNTSALGRAWEADADADADADNAAMKADSAGGNHD